MLAEARKQTDLLDRIESELIAQRGCIEWAWNGHPMPVAVTNGR